MKIFLIGNYSKDKQESMFKYAEMLERELTSRNIRVSLIKPPVVFGLLCNKTNKGIKKWIGYIDKWIVAPFYLKLFSLFNKGVYHICDHSNAAYINFIPLENAVVTCHDVLAIRGAQGESSAYCQASGMGRLLQRTILKSLKKTKYLISVSRNTDQELREICNDSQANHEDWIVIHNPQNNSFAEVPNKNNSRNELLKINKSLKSDYILHVGSNLARKNRMMLVKLLKEIESQWDGIICFAGHPPSQEIISCLNEYKLSHRYCVVENVLHEELVLLYNYAYALIFPSYSEGFGWPIIEAQACGAPVICSDVDPLPEVSGGAAIHIQPDDVKKFADSVISLKDEGIRSNLIRQGLLNADNFSPDVIIDKYIKYYQSVLIAS